MFDYMFKIISKFLAITLAALYMGILFILPFEWHKIGLHSEIFPAFDLIIIYYLSTYKKMHYWHLFIAGMLIDQLYNLPIGISSLAFIFANLGLRAIGKWFLLRDYLTNLTVFCIYSIFITLSRYLLVTIDSTHHIEGFSLLFYFLTTIFSYPVICVLIEKPIKILGNYAR